MLIGQGQIFVFILVFVVGLIFGAAGAWWLAGSRKSDEPELDVLVRLRSQYLEQASIWRDRVQGKLGVRVGDQIIENPKQLNDAQMKALWTLTKDWNDWVGMPDTASTKVTEPLEPILTPATILITPPPVAPAAPAHEPALMTPLVVASSPSKSQPTAVINKPKSIVEQIDDILQAKLAGSAGHSKGVRLVEDPVYGVVVWIGINHFNGVDQVNDPEVKALLREAASEWEQRAQPGQIK